MTTSIDVKQVDDIEPINTDPVTEIELENSGDFDSLNEYVDGVISFTSALESVIDVIKKDEHNETANLVLEKYSDYVCTKLNIEPLNISKSTALEESENLLVRLYKFIKKTILAIWNWIVNLFKKEKKDAKELQKESENFERVLNKFENRLLRKIEEVYKDEKSGPTLDWTKINWKVVENGTVDETVEELKKNIVSPKKLTFNSLEDFSKYKLCSLLPLKEVDDKLQISNANVKTLWDELDRVKILYDFIRQVEHVSYGLMVNYSEVIKDSYIVSQITDNPNGALYDDLIKSPLTFVSNVYESSFKDLEGVHVVEKNSAASQVKHKRPNIPMINFVPHMSFKTDFVCGIRLILLTYESPEDNNFPESVLVLDTGTKQDSKAAYLDAYSKVKYPIFVEAESLPRLKILNDKISEANKLHIERLNDFYDTHQEVSKIDIRVSDRVENKTAHSLNKNSMAVKSCYRGLRQSTENMKVCLTTFNNMNKYRELILSSFLNLINPTGKT